MSVSGNIHNYTCKNSKHLQCVSECAGYCKSGGNNTMQISSKGKTALRKQHLDNKETDFLIFLKERWRKREMESRKRISSVFFKLSNHNHLEGYSG